MQASQNGRKYSFQFRSSYLNTVSYDFFDGTEAYQVRLRTGTSAYERSIFNGDEAEWQRDVVAGIGRLVRGGSIDKPVPSDVIDAFNAWRLSTHQESIAKIENDPEKFGPLPPDDPIRQPPIIAISGFYVVGEGWLPKIQ